MYFELYMYCKTNSLDIRFRRFLSGSEIKALELEAQQLQASLEVPDTTLVSRRNVVTGGGQVQTAVVRSSRVSSSKASKVSSTDSR